MAQNTIWYILLCWNGLIKTIVICLLLRSKLRFKGFKSFFGTYSLKVVQSWFIWHETWRKTLFRYFYCNKKVRIENNSDMLGITFKVAFFSLFKTLLALTSLLSFEPCMKLGTQHYLVCIIFLKWLEWRTIVVCLKFSAN